MLFFDILLDPNSAESKIERYFFFKDIILGAQLCSILSDVVTVEYWIFSNITEGGWNNKIILFQKYLKQT